MKVLVIGSGGREHALAWKLAQSNAVDKVFCAPGNGGTARGLKCQNVNISATDIDALIEFASKKRIDLTVVGPEAPLVAGIVDRWPEDLAIWGPKADAAQLEGSKIFAKKVMEKCNIPTAPWLSFDDPAVAARWLDQQAEDTPWVVKADGLAAGKGVFVCNNQAETYNAITQMETFGDAGKRFIIEKLLEGKEASFFALCSKNGQVIPLATAADYKRAYNGDRGPNTGGMGSYSPANHLTSEQQRFIVNKIIRPTIEATGFTGFLYVGVMLTSKGLFVLEFNVRMGDPETQVILPRLQTDLFQVLRIMSSGKTIKQELRWSEQSAVTVVMTEKGYPGPYGTGHLISGSFDWPRSVSPGAIVFQAGTILDGDKLKTNSGRVLSVTGLGDDVADAREIAYGEAGMFHWEGAAYRKDIAENI